MFTLLNKVMQSNDSNSKNPKVSLVSNNLIYTGKISYDGAHEFQKKIIEYMDKCRKRKRDNKEEDDESCKKLNIHITSGGGNVSSGIAMMNAVEDANEHVQTTCHARGFVGSAATYAAFACNERCAAANTQFLLHPPSKNGVSGQTEDLLVSAENLKSTHDNILNIYERKTKKPRMLDRITANYMDNRYSSAREMMDLGLIDRVKE